MKRLLLLSTLLLSLSSQAQMKKAPASPNYWEIRCGTNYYQFMRENPRHVSCQNFDNKAAVLLGIGYDKRVYFDLGVMFHTQIQQLDLGLIASIQPHIGTSLSPVAQWKVWRSNKTGYTILRAGLRGNIALEKGLQNGIQPYIGWSIPSPLTRRFQFNMGYEYKLGLKTEKQNESNALHLGLWFFL